MKPGERSDLFQDWNPGTSDDAAPKPADRTMSWRVGPRRKIEPYEATKNYPPAARIEGDPVLNFTFHDDSDDRSSLPNFLAPAGETLGGRGKGGGDQTGPIPFPEPGGGIGGFRLVSELGRGAFGRVFLAEESLLGNRPVALKVTRAEGDEPRLLARLQHTHIVPIHSVHDDPETGLRLMCMPYFGGANLAQVLDAASASDLGRGAPRSLIDALDVVGHPSPSDSARPIPASAARSQAWPSSVTTLKSVSGSAWSGSSAGLRSILGRIPWWSRSIGSLPRPKLRPRTRAKALDDRDPVQPARRFLREASFVRASAWIAARLAEGLEHAHSRGLLHRDLKPSNILIAADGTPMLLDFNLAADALNVDQGDRARIGGTMPYMAPEHLDAFNPDGSTSPESVDERADTYALTLILFEMVAGRHAFAEQPPGRPILEVIRLMTEERRGPAPSPRRVNHGVPRGLDAIIRKGLDPDPARRHARAGDLAEDLRRFLDDRPLKYTPERSLVERASKFVRRNPRITGGTTVGLLSLVMIVLICGAAWTATRHLGQIAVRLKLRVFETKFSESQFLLNTTGGPVSHLGRGITLAEEAIAQAGVDLDGGKLVDPWFSTLPAVEEQEVRRDLSELILLVARARVVQAERSRSESRRRKALEAAVTRLDFAQKLDPKPPQTLFDDRAQYHSALGDADLAAADRKRRDATQPTTGRDFYLLGSSLLARNQPDRAEPKLLKAVGLDPRRFWSWFALGLCHYDQSRFPEAAGDFAVCAVLAPKFSWPWMNRGLALARAGRLVEAREMYDRAIEVDDRFAEALAKRGLTAMELGDFEAAVADLKKAVSLGLKTVAVQAALAEANARAGHREEALDLLAALIKAEPEDPTPRIARGTLLIHLAPEEAQADFLAVLALNPLDPAAHLGMARLLRRSDPRAALAEANLAVKGDPNRIDAIELRAWLLGKLGDPAALADVAQLSRFPTPHRLYNAACAVSLLFESCREPTAAGKAIDLLRRAIESGIPLDPIRKDPDFQALKANPEFQKLIASETPAVRPP